jgi:hypothetical protein
MASGLHLLGAWEELAEDPFRGLRAGPADFSPSSFQVCKALLPMVFRIPPGTPTLPHPELPNTAEVCPDPRIEGADQARKRALGSQGSSRTGASWLRLGSAWRVV